MDKAMKMLAIEPVTLKDVSAGILTQLVAIAKEKGLTASDTYRSMTDELAARRRLAFKTIAP